MTSGAELRPVVEAAVAEALAAGRREATVQVPDGIIVGSLPIPTVPADGEKFTLTFKGPLPLTIGIWRDPDAPEYPPIAPITWHLPD